jgi:FKBP-type peptidyl-prolyl cis-trans isomerase
VADRFDAGLYGMCTGERRHLVILPAFAYGANGTSDGAIPPNSTLGKLCRFPQFACSPFEEL